MISIHILNFFHRFSKKHTNKGCQNLGKNFRTEWNRVTSQSWLNKLVGMHASIEWLVLLGAGTGFFIHIPSPNVQCIDLVWMRSLPSLIIPNTIRFHRKWFLHWPASTILVSSWQGYVTYFNITHSGSTLSFPKWGMYCWMCQTTLSCHNRNTTRA